ncbi:MAG: glycosyltransferase [Eubacteriales bacterium]|nr:glycosyltransferase [Eubacteriales bacterium]MDD4630531.1 glycosyltransferase [Eubacteriales bacterium]
MSRKILFTASTKSHIENFHLPYLKAFEDIGWEVKAVALPVSKSFFSFQNICAILSTRRLLLSEGFDVVSSQSTLAGIVTRLAVMLAGKSKLSKRIKNPGKQVKIFHTAHGYLFHDDNSLKKWAYILPEMLCGKVTDVLMVMNHEDLDIAKKYKLGGKSHRIYYIDGMGIDLSKFEAVKTAPQSVIDEWKKSFGLKENDFAFVYAAEFSKRKNHELLLKGFAKALDVIRGLEEMDGAAEKIETTDKAETLEKAEAAEKKEPANLSSENLKLVLAGEGALLEDTKSLAAELGIKDQVLFAGYVRNIPELYSCCQAAVTTSRIEGLPFNVMEAMACGLPVVASDIKGHRELIDNGENGLLFESGDLEGLVEQMVKICIDSDFRKRCEVISAEKIKQFSLENVFADIMGVYKAVS